MVWLSKLLRELLQLLGSKEGCANLNLALTTNNKESTQVSCDMSGGW